MPASSARWTPTAAYIRIKGRVLDGQPLGSASSTCPGRRPPKPAQVVAQSQNPEEPRQGEVPDLVTVAEPIPIASHQPGDDARVGVLVDFDNALPPTDLLTASSLRHVLLACIRHALSLVDGAPSIHVRLYGGWMSGAILSRRGSEVAALLQEADPFPLVTEGGLTVRGTLELATGIIDDPGMVLEDTYRRRSGVPRLRLANTPLPHGCASEPATCPAKILARFTKASHKQCPVEACTVVASSAFTVHEQKMVDTLLVCDLLALLDDSRCRAILLLSGDTDFVPALVLARRKSGIALSWLIPSQAIASEDFAEFVRLRGVEVGVLSAEVA